VEVFPWSGTFYVPVAEQSIIELEEKIRATLDRAERQGLLRLLIKALDNLAREVEFKSIVQRRLADSNERVNRQKKLVARLKRNGHDTKDAYFLLVTLKTMQALFAHRCALTRKILVCVVPQKS
jgi:hypothetical protein